VFVVESGVIVEANEAFLRIVGHSSEDIESRSLDWRRLLCPESVPSAEDAVAEMLDTGVFPPREQSYLSKDGARISVLASGAILSREPRLRWACFVADMTGQKCSEEALRTTEARFRNMIEAAQEGILEIDLQGRITFLNPRVAGMVGYRAEEILGESVFPFIDEKYHALVVEKLASRPNPNPERFELKLRRKDGTAVWAITSGSKLINATGAYTGSLVLLTDVTARKNAEEDLATKNRQLRRLSAEVLRSQDVERRRLARELHDGTGQMLTGLVLNLGRLEHLAPPGTPEGELLSETISLARQCTNEIRATSYGLHPPLLDELGLITAIRVFAEGFQKRTGIQLDVDLPPDFGRIDRDMELALFRIVQEAISNVHRHSGSACALIRLTRDPQEVRLEIQDRGRGFSPGLINGSSTSRSLQGVGLLSMRERAEQFGGHMEVASTPDGSNLAVTLPFAASDPPLPEGVVLPLYDSMIALRMA